MHEDVVHLHEGEDHVEDWVDAGEDVPGATLTWDFKEMDKLCHMMAPLIKKFLVCHATLGSFCVFSSPGQQKAAKSIKVAQCTLLLFAYLFDLFDNFDEHRRRIYCKHCRDTVPRAGILSYGNAGYGGRITGFPLSPPFP